MALVYYGDERISRAKAQRRKKNARKRRQFLSALLCAFAPLREIYSNKRDRSPVPQQPRVLPLSLHPKCYEATTKRSIATTESRSPSRLAVEMLRAAHLVAPER